MRRFPVCLIFLAWVAPLAAQTPKFELLLGGLLLDTRENRLIGKGAAAVTGKGEGRLAGGELLLRASGIGLGGRYLVGDMDSSRGAFAPGRQHIADARLIFGPQAFGIELGGMYRRIDADSTERQWFYGRVGARSTLFIGASGVAVTFAGAYYPYIYEDTKESGGKGWEGETAVRYARRGIPLFIQVGYRYQTFQPDTKNRSPHIETSGITLEAGIRLGK
ncbi:MAG TPA: hypothetical protein VG692_11915 [Gemmatimonadales bacterium]|nr:hypothetical protein [Gemmatimonadales bacterium]